MKYFATAAVALGIAIFAMGDVAQAGHRAPGCSPYGGGYGGGFGGGYGRGGGFGVPGHVGHNHLYQQNFGRVGYGQTLYGQRSYFGGGFQNRNRLGYGRSTGFNNRRSGFGLSIGFGR